MKMFVTLCSLLITGLIAAQTDTLVTTLTENHLRVPGTSVYVILPSDYKPGDSFNGFASQGRNAQLRIEQSETIGFDARLNTLNDMLGRGGLKVTEYSDLIYNGYRAKFIRTEAGNVLGTAILLFGDEHFYIQLGGTYMLNDKPSANTMRTAMLMSVYQPQGI